MKSGDDDKDKPDKASQAAEMAHIIHKLSNPPGGKQRPVIFGCDFNTKPGSPAFQVFEAVTAALNLNLTSSYKEFNGIELEISTAKWRWGGAQLNKVGKTAQTIDFIFKTKEWKCTRVLSVPTLKAVEETSPQWLPSKKYPSDHFCIGADLELA